MRLLVTRPDEDASATIAALEALGHEAVAAPLLTIEPLADAAIPDEAWQAILITSANGVRAIAGHPDFKKFRSVPVLTVGAASAEAAREAGFVSVVSAEGNVELLVELAASKLDPSSGPLLHVAGSVTAGNLKGGLEAQGFRVVRVVLYQAQAAKHLPEAARDALTAGTIDGVLFYSPRTAASFAALVRAAELEATLKPLTAYCLSAPVAEALAGLPFCDIRVSAEPRQSALLSLIGI